MEIKLVDRTGTHARYFVYADSGDELRQVSRDISEDLAEARRKRVSLISIILRKEAAQEGQEIILRSLEEVSVPSAPIPPHGHDVADHEHPEYSTIQEHEHE